MPRSKQDIEALRKMPYKEYLKTDWWKKVRNLVLMFWYEKCALCNSGKFVEVHHRTYERRGQEKLSDCVALCKVCHETVHEFAKISRGA